MGLDTTHNCWHGPYSVFNDWRRAVAHAAGLPPLELMEGFGPIVASVLCAKTLKQRLPIKWECLRPRPVLALLNHSDCDGQLLAHDLAGIAHDLETLLPDLAAMGWGEETRRFIRGLREAAENHENVVFQ